MEFSKILVYVCFQHTSNPYDLGGQNSKRLRCWLGPFHLEGSLQRRAPFCTPIPPPLPFLSLLRRGNNEYCKALPAQKYMVEKGKKIE